MPPGCFYNLLSGHRVEFVPKFFQFVCSVDLFNDVSTSIITTFNKDAMEITRIGWYTNTNVFSGPFSSRFLLFVSLFLFMIILFSYSERLKMKKIYAA